jgi:hypothetical protein
MPLSLAPDDRKLLLIATVVLILLIGAAILAVPAGDATTNLPTTYSTASQGAKAAYLLLRESGYEVERWEQSPLDLPSPRGTTLVLASPTALPNSAERARLLKFIAAGGHLIATGAIAATLLPQNDSTPDPFGAGALLHYKALAPSLFARIAPDITMAPEAKWTVKSPAIPLYGSEDQAVAIKYLYGEGEIIWWAGPTPLTNAGLREPGNLEFLLACVGDRQNTRVLWDEYFHGYRQSLSGTLAHTQIGWMFAQFGLLLVFVLLTFSRRSGPIRALAGQTRLSPLEFVETLGGVYQHAGAGAVCVEVYYQRFRYWLIRRLGVAANTAIPNLERLAAERWRFQDPEFASVLRRCESARSESNLPPKQALRLVQQLHGFAVRLHLYPAAKQEKH